MKIKFLHLSVKETLFVIIIMFMIFFSFAIKYISPYFQYLDDIFTIIFMGIAIFKNIFDSKKGKLNKYDRYILILGAILIIIGLVGNFISKYQINVKAILIDILSFCKFFGIYLAGIIIFYDEKEERYFEISEYFSKIILVIIGCIALLNYIFNWGLATDKNRFGITVYTLGGHPSFASAVTSCCVSILLYDFSKNKKWIFLGLILTALTLRMKAMVYVVLMLIYIIFNKQKKYFQIKKFFIYAVVAIIIARPYISNYFFDLTASRGLALKSSIELATTFFPIGSGFATFGTTGSIISYSNAYEILGLNTRYGFMKDASAFIGDGGWATEIGQFGLLGVVILMIMLFLMYRSVETTVKQNSTYAPYVSIFLYLLICSTSETTFSSNYAIFFAIALVILIKKGQIKNEIGKKKK